MNLSTFFINRPIFAGVISVIIFLAGLISLTQLPVSEYPEVTPPSVVVNAQFPGANPKVILETGTEIMIETSHGHMENIKTLLKMEIHIFSISCPDQAFGHKKKCQQDVH